MKNDATILNFARGELVDTRPLHKPPLVREFVKSLTLHAEGYRP